MQTKGLHAPQAAVRATMAVVLWSLCVISAGAETRDGRFERTFAVGGDTLVLDVQTGSGADPAHAHLVEVPAGADGFHFPYYLFVPRGTPRGQSVRLLVEPNNTGQTTDDFGRHREHAKRMASRGDARRLADRLRTPLLVPVFPRPSHNGLYTHALDRDTMLWANDPLRRIDLQLIEMIRHARRLLLRNGVAAHRKVFLHGFSASGTFVNRFAALHPDLVRAVAAGGINGLPILPFAALRTTPLPYPVGVGDLETIVGTPFDLAAYRRVSQYLHMGYLDRNDTLPYGDAWNDTERALIARLLGEEMMPTRWERGRMLLAEAQLPVQTVTYNGVAHRILPEMWDDIVAFFEANDGEAHTSISPHPYRFVPYRRIEDRTQLTAFVEHAGFEFTLSAPGHDEIRILRDAFCGTGTSGDGGFQAFYVCLDPATIEAIAAGIEYTLTPINAGDAHAWIVRDGVRLLRP